ncbi:MAG: hypothetical protein U0Y68_22295 [Blastocatellia bacterium]
MIPKKYFAVVWVLMLMAFSVPSLAQEHQHQTQSGCKNCQQQDKGKGQMGGQMGGMMGGGQMQDMQTIHALFADHEKITRTIRKIDKGIETVTESDDPKVQAMIKEHVAAMYKRLENKQPIRMWDPLFVEIFKNADKIKMQMEPTPKGLKIIETSDDPWVVQLIQSHAEGVSEFVKEGMPSMHKEHPLPGAKPEAKAFLGKGDGVTTCPVTGEAIDKNVSAEINGKTVYFCCASCRDTVKKNPELYLKSDKN